ncbi:MAG: proton-conducting transporter membrane subunit [Gammaproteobacteria bacterium]
MISISAGNLLPVIIILPLIAAVLIRLAGNYPNLRESITIVTSVVLFLLLLPLVPLVLQGVQPAYTIAEPFPGLPLQLTLEPLGMLFALVAGFLWIVTSIYSIGYMRGHHEENQTRFFLFFAVAIAVTMGVAFAGNLLTLFVFYEMLTLSTYPLVTHAGTDDARRAGRVYLGILISTSIAFLLLAMIWAWSLAGTLEFRAGGILAGTASPMLLGVLLFLFFFGVGKAALMPFHRWLPAAMVAPTPVSALLHAVAVVKAGVFTLLKIAVYIFGTDVMADLPAAQALSYIAAASILLASLVALTKDNLKARLAYSTVSQLGYITLGALLAATGVIGGAMHIVMHGFAKITLFFGAGAVLVAAHKTEISQLDGLGRRMPITFGAFFIATLSIIGLPPLGGMWSKWYLGMATLEAGEWFLLATLMLSSLLNIGYLVPISIRAFFGKSDDGSSEGMKEAPLTCVFAMMVTSLACVMLFFFPEPWYRLASMAVLF